MSDRCCKTCRFLRVHPDASGRIVVRKRNAYECVVVVPQPVLPNSITGAYSFRWPLDRTYMTGDGGTTCPTWEKR